MTDPSDAYLDSAAELLGLDLSADRAAVSANFRRLARIAAHLDEFPLPPDLDPAPVFVALPAVAPTDPDRTDAIACSDSE